MAQIPNSHSASTLQTVIDDEVAALVMLYDGTTAPSGGLCIAKGTMSISVNTAGVGTSGSQAYGITFSAAPLIFLQPVYPTATAGRVPVHVVGSFTTTAFQAVTIPPPGLALVAGSLVVNWLAIGIKA